MGRIAIVLDIEPNTDDGEDIRDIKVDLGGGDVRRVPMLNAPGVDSAPRIGDYVVLVSHPGDSGFIAVAYDDSAVESQAESGEIRVYSRDSGSAVVAEIWIKSDGSISVQNGSGYVKLEPSGRVDVNGNLRVEP